MAPLLAVSLCCLSASLLSPCCTLAAADGGGKPLVMAVTKDPATLLYTSPIKDSHRPLVLDLAGPLIWSTCDAAHATFECHHHECAHAHRYHPPSCPHSGYGKPDAEDRFRCKCTAHPYNPFSVETVTDDLTRATLSANATDGANPLYLVSFSAVTTCAPDSMLAKLPAGAVGVAGLATSRLALPAQVARTQKLANKFLLCLPRSGFTALTEGVAIFGESPFFTVPSGPVDLTSTLTYTSLLKRLNSPAYYLPVKNIAVGKAFHEASGWNDLRVPAVPPFELCYNSSRLPNTRIGRLAPDIDLVLGDGKNYPFGSFESMVELQGPRRATCFAFVEMKKAGKGGGYGTAQIGGFQMENNLLKFDMEKMQLGFAKVPFWTQCSLFNFTQPGH